MVLDNFQNLAHHTGSKNAQPSHGKLSHRDMEAKAYASSPNVNQSYFRNLATVRARAAAAERAHNF